MGHPLDNPIWSSLVTRHRRFAIGEGLARRFDPEIAPFAGIAAADDVALRDLAELVSPGDSVGMLNVFPGLETPWEVVKAFDCVQMVCDAPSTSAEQGSEIVWLTETDVSAMLDLTALVYPAYFRRGTAELGPYCGIKEGGRLCAMAGIRMAMDGYQEISAVCTHPEFRGRSFASRLMRHLVRHIQSAGDVPFLHTESDNEAALAMYERVGFRRRAVLPFRGLRRT